MGVAAPPKALLTPTQWHGHWYPRLTHFVYLPTTALYPESLTLQHPLSAIGWGVRRGTRDLKKKKNSHYDPVLPVAGHFFLPPLYVDSCVLLNHLLKTQHVGVTYP